MPLGYARLLDFERSLFLIRLLLCFPSQDAFGSLLFHWECQSATTAASAIGASIGELLRASPGLQGEFIDKGKSLIGADQDCPVSTT